MTQPINQDENRPRRRDELRLLYILSVAGRPWLKSAEDYEWLRLDEVCCLIREAVKSSTEAQPPAFPRFDLKKCGALKISPSVISHRGKRMIQSFLKEDLLRSATAPEIGWPWETSGLQTTTKLSDILSKHSDNRMESVTQHLDCHPASCKQPLMLDIGTEIVQDKTGQHIPVTVKCPECRENQERPYMRVLTGEQTKLMYLIRLYTMAGHGQEAPWIAYTALQALMIEGIDNGVFPEWDYAPSSVQLPFGRRFLNISREGEDDLNDLASEGLVEELRMTTAKHQFTTNYRVSEEGAELLEDVSKEIEKDIQSFTSCLQCGHHPLDVTTPIESEIDEGCDFVCPKCHQVRVMAITRIRNVNYRSDPFYPSREGADDDHGA